MVSYEGSNASVSPVETSIDMDSSSIQIDPTKSEVTIDFKPIDGSDVINNEVSDITSRIADISDDIDEHDSRIEALEFQWDGFTKEVNDNVTAICNSNQITNDLMKDHMKLVDESVKAYNEIESVIKHYCVTTLICTVVCVMSLVAHVFIK